MEQEPPEPEKTHVVIERVLVSNELNLWLSIVSYCLLIFVTLFVGFDIYKGIKIGKFVLTKEQSNRIATIILILIWIIMIAVQGLRLRNLSNT
jgi:hypothetical protein